MTLNWILLCLVVVLLAASAFFVAAEFSLIAARRTVIEPLAVNSRRARSTLRAMENVSLMMACAQLGITLCGVLLGALGEPAVAALLEPVFAALGVPEAWLHPVALVDRAAARGLRARGARRDGAEEHRDRRAGADRARAGAGAAGRRHGHRADHPVPERVRELRSSAPPGRQPKDEVTSSFTREEVADLVAESRAEGLLDAEEHQRITSALDFDVTAVGA